MKDHTTDNLLFLRKHYPKIYHAVRNKERNKTQYVLSESKSGFLTLSYSGKDGSVKPVYYHSQYNPEHEAKRWVEQHANEIAKVKHLLIFGIGLAYQLEQIIRLYPDKRIYLYEPDLEVMLALMQARDLKPLLSHQNLITFGVGNDHLTREQFVYWFIRHVTDSYYFLHLPAYQKRYDIELSQFMTDLREIALNERSNIATSQVFKDTWTMNVLRNLSTVLKSCSISGLKDAFKGIPAVIVGSGPSLMDDFESLKKIKDHSIIIAAGTSIQALLSNRILPHFVVSIDGGEANYRAFHDVDLDGVALVYSPFVHHKITKKKAARLIHLFFDFDVLTKYLLDAKNVPAFYSTSSVTGTAIQFAHYLGCPTIVLTGQDMSFPGRQHYSSDIDHISESTLELMIREADEEIENVTGGYNPTSKKMLVTLRDLERLLDLIQIQTEGVRFINTSKRGAKIRRTEYVPMEHMVEEFRQIRVKTEWVYDQLDRHTAPYSSDVGQNAYNILIGFRNGLEEMGENLAKLMGQILELDQPSAQTIGHLSTIEKSWVAIAESPIFQHLYRFAFEGQISALERYFSEIKLSANLAEKSALIQRYLGTFVQSLILQTPHLGTILDETIRTMEAEHPVTH